MKKITVIYLLFIFSCNRAETNQKKAERTVIGYNYSSYPKSVTDSLKFTSLDNNNVIGVIEDKTIYSTDHRPVLIKTVYYMLNKSLTHVEATFTN